MSHTFPPIQAITQGPQHHWFGYYDKCQIDPTNRYALGMAVDFEHRSPTSNDTIQLGIIDMNQGNTWTNIATTHAWCWQQGCMLQWVPNSATDIIWNDRDGDHFISKIHTPFWGGPITHLTTTNFISIKTKLITIHNPLVRVL